ncbi:small ribosomal subunit protein mS26 [Gastrophryne carolinensis]
MLRIPRATPLLLRQACTPQVTPSRGRKSRHDPPAKSKVSRIKYPPMVDVEELLNVRRRYQDYTTVIAALRSAFRKELSQSRHEQQVGLLAEQRHQQEREEHAALMAWNQEENTKALLRRLDRLKLEERAFQLQRAATNQLHEEAQLQNIREREKEVEHLQELSKTFITPENLTERIEAALDQPKSYNFCLDREGRVLRLTTPGNQA